MYLKQSDSTASLQLSSQRKRDLLDHFEANGDELDRWREFNAAYHEDDRKFMQFLIPPGKRVLELGCGRGDLLAALKPSYGVGIDFGAETIAKANARHPDLYFVLGDVEDQATLTGIEGPFDYIVIADTIGMFEDIDGTLAAGASSLHALDAHHHLLLLPSVGAGSEACRSAAAAQQATENQLHRHRRLPEPDGSRRFRGDPGKSSGNCCRGAGSASGPFINRFIAPLPGIRQLCLRTYIVGRPVRQFPDRKFSASILIPCRNEKGNIENAILRMPEIRQLAGNPVRRGKFQRRHV